MARGSAGGMATCAPEVTTGRPWWQRPPVIVGAGKEALEVRHAMMRVLGLAARDEEAWSSEDRRW